MGIAHKSLRETNKSEHIAFWVEEGHKQEAELSSCSSSSCVINSTTTKQPNVKWMPRIMLSYS